jgi:predicted RNA-binding protein
MISDFEEAPIDHPIDLTENHLPKSSTRDLYYKKKRLIDMVKGLSKEEHIEVFKVFRDHHENYSENNNGIFINLNTIRESVIDEILKYIEYMNVKKSDLIQEEMKKDTTKQLLGDCSKVVVNNFDLQKPIYQEYEFQADHASITNEKITEFLKFLDPRDLDPNKITLKRKKNKYQGSMAKMINSFKEPKDGSIMKNNQHKSYSEEK